MSTIITCTPPAGADPRDVRATIAANQPAPPDAVLVPGDGTVQVVYLTFVPTAQQITTLQTAVAATTPDPNAPWNVQANLINKAQTALTNNQTYLNIQGTPTNAQVLAQVNALTRQVDAIIQLLLATGTQVGT